MVNQRRWDGPVLRWETAALCWWWYVSEMGQGSLRESKKGRGSKEQPTSSFQTRGKHVTQWDVALEVALLFLGFCNHNLLFAFRGGAHFTLAIMAERMIH